MNYRKSKHSILSSPAAVLLLCAALFVSGCSGTGTMYRPDSEENEEESAGSADTAAQAADEQEDGGAEGSAAGGSRERAHSLHQASLEDPDKEIPVKIAFLEGDGSDLYSVKTIDYYYGFSLDGMGLQLPCSAAALTDAGWSILPSPDSGREKEEKLISSYSYDFFDAVFIGSTDSSDESEKSRAGQDPGYSSQKKIRLCLANPTGRPIAPESCTVCGISASLDSGVSLQTVFGAGPGSTLSDLTAVFGTDDSVCTQTRYSDGTSSLSYRFSNGLTVHEHLPVLAEAEEKSLAECLIADTAQDGQTISKLSLYYFRLSDTDEDVKKAIADKEAEERASGEYEEDSEEDDYADDGYYYDVQTVNENQDSSRQKKEKKDRIRELGPSD